MSSEDHFRSSTIVRIPWPGALPAPSFGRTPAPSCPTASLGTSASDRIPVAHPRHGARARRTPAPCRPRIRQALRAASVIPPAAGPKPATARRLVVNPGVGTPHPQDLPIRAHGARPVRRSERPTPALASALASGTTARAARSEGLGTVACGRSRSKKKSAARRARPRVVRWAVEVGRAPQDLGSRDS